MMELLFRTQGDWPGFIIRIVLGAIMLPHGAQKLFGWFGGYGFNATMEFFTGTMKLPWAIALCVVLIEFFGSIGLLLGIGTKIWATGLLIIMIGAICTTNFKNGFFMNWFGSQPGEGFEYHLLVIGMCLTLLLTGSGRFSLDSLILKG